MAKLGSRLRHIQGPSLPKIEETIEALPYKVEIINVNRVGSNWFVHFYIPSFQNEKSSVKLKKEVAKETKTINRGK
jgi:hypothetical protein